MRPQGRSTSAWRKKIRNSGAQRPGEDFECAQRYIAFAAFNRADVSSMKSTGFSKRFLRQLVLLSECANVVRENFSELRGRLSHDVTALK